MADLRDVLTVVEAAQELGLTPVAVRAAIMRGVLRTVRLDRRTNLIPTAEVERYRREHRGQRGKRKKTPATQPVE